MQATLSLPLFSDLLGALTTRLRLMSNLNRLFSSLSISCLLSTNQECGTFVSLAYDLDGLLNRSPLLAFVHKFSYTSKHVKSKVLTLSKGINFSNLYPKCLCSSVSENFSFNVHFDSMLRFQWSIIVLSLKPCCLVGRSIDSFGCHLKYDYSGNFG